MKAQLVIKNDKAVYGALTEKGDYTVLSLDGPDDLELGDWISGTLDDSDGLFKEIRNLTKDLKVRICIENWECSREVALDFLYRINNPRKIFFYENDQA
jgi:hypothetical protein